MHRISKRNYINPKIRLIPKQISFDFAQAKVQKKKYHEEHIYLLKLVLSYFYVRTYNLPNYELLNEKETSDECKNYTVFVDIDNSGIFFVPSLFPFNNIFKCRLKLLIFKILSKKITHLGIRVVEGDDIFYQL